MRARRARSRTACFWLAGCWLACVSLGHATPASADDLAPEPSPLAAPTAKTPGPPPPRSALSVGWTVLMYLPNRVFDLCDVVRLRARVGDGFAVGAHVTRYAPIFVGSYEALWVGLPGPRGRASLPLPIGFEEKAGVDAGPAGVSSHSRAPVYGVGEVGAGVQVYLVGAEAGVDFYEIADFLAGFALIDFAHDDF